MSDNGRRAMSDNGRRALLILGALSVLVGIAVADAGNGGAQGAATPSSGAAAVSVSTATGVAGRRAESAAWFCVGGTGAGGVAPSQLLFTNPVPTAVTATATSVAVGATSMAPVPPVALLAPGHAQVAVAPAPGVTGGLVASTVVLDEGGVGVSQVVSGALGFSTAPCASTTARHWYFANASTAQGATVTLSLFNPTATIAVVDVSFVTAGGVIAPPAYQGIDVPGNSLVAENVGDHLPDTAAMATTVTTLSGAVVAAELETYSQAGSGGPSIILGTKQPATSWSFAQNTDVSTGATVFHVFNPTPRPATVTVTVGLAEGAAEPIVLHVAPQSVATLDTHKVTRIPLDTAFAATFRSSRGVGIIVDRHVTAPPAAAAPEQGDTVGVPGAATRWLLPTVSAPATQMSLAVVNPNRRAVTISVSTFSDRGLVAVPGLRRVRIAPGAPFIVAPTPGSAVGSLPLELRASGPVAVEMDALPVGSSGVVVIPALPLP
jgi:hypothetical protein